MKNRKSEWLIGPMSLEKAELKWNQINFFPLVFMFLDVSAIFNTLDQSYFCFQGKLVILSFIT